MKHLIGCLLISTVAYADDAAGLFEQGRIAKEQGDLVAACKLFEQSYDLERAAGTALNLGECEEVAGNWEYALELYEGAAKVFEQNGRVESARFARARAEKLRAQRAPKPTPVPAAPPPARAEAGPSKVALGVAIGGLTVSAIGAVAWWLARRDIEAFEDVNMFGPGTVPEQLQVTEEDCGDLRFIDLSVQAKFEDACAAYDRQRWLTPATLVSGAVGIVALTYYFWTKPKRGKSMAVTPTASGGMVATFEW